MGDEVGTKSPTGCTCGATSSAAAAVCIRFPGLSGEDVGTKSPGTGGFKNRLGTAEGRGSVFWTPPAMGVFAMQGEVVSPVCPLRGPDDGTKSGSLMTGRVPCS